MLKNQNGQVVGKATFSTWVTQTKAEFRESEVSLTSGLLNDYSPQTKSFRWKCSDWKWLQRSCTEEMLGCLSRTHTSQRKNKPVWRLPCCDAARICGPSKPAGMVWLPVAKLPWQLTAVQCSPGQPHAGLQGTPEAELLRNAAPCGTAPRTALSHPPPSRSHISLSTGAPSSPLRHRAK